MKNQEDNRSKQACYKGFRYKVAAKWIWIFFKAFCTMHENWPRFWSPKKKLFEQGFTNIFRLDFADISEERIKINIITNKNLELSNKSKK